jgi:XTP/dITP diphosphohydrolase
MVETRTILLASQNPGKLGEMRQLLDGLSFHVIGPLDLGIADSPAETGQSFLENATIKARYYARLSGLVTIADDSGLCVDALNGGPGLYTSRFGGDGATDEQRNFLLLRCLRNVPHDQRGARFTSAVVAVRSADVVFSAVETVEGRITEAPRGANGFGYDPVFFYPPFNRTFAEVGAADKARVSHRGKAFAHLRQFFDLDASLPGEKP